MLMIAFTSTHIYNLNVSIRLLSGLMKVFLPIFTPVWVDSFGSEKSKSILMSVTLMGAVVGFFIGFQLTFITNWQYGVYCQSMCLLCCMTAIFLTPHEYLNIEKAIKVRK